MCLFVTYELFVKSRKLFLNNPRMSANPKVKKSNKLSEAYSWHYSIPGFPNKMHRLYNIISSKMLNLLSLNSYSNFAQFEIGC